jgi:hypothetical protein
MSRRINNNGSGVGFYQLQDGFYHLSIEGYKNPFKVLNNGILDSQNEKKNLFFEFRVVPNFSIGPIGLMIPFLQQCVYVDEVTEL